jgi:hypothetical protein
VVEGVEVAGGGGVSPCHEFLSVVIEMNSI